MIGRIGNSHLHPLRYIPSRRTAFRARKPLLSCGASLLAASFAAPAFADGQSQVETVVVTGTMMRTTQTPSPVTIISRAQIDNSSLTTVTDVVRAVSADNSGTIPTAFTGGFAEGGSGVALRGLTVNSTLVLIDGLRTTNYPLADDGERGFVDLNTIPLDAVDRIDVLKDGASSIYGSDAIAGVVNIILKPDFQGEAGEAETGTSQHGGGTTGRVTAMFGTGDPSTDHYNAYVDFEYEVDEAITVGQRGFPFDTNDLTSIGGIDLNAGQPGQDSGSIYGSVTPAMLMMQGNVLTGMALPNAVSQPLQPCGPRSKQMTDSSGNVYCEQNTTLYTGDQPYESRFGVYARGTFYPNAHTTAYMNLGYFQNDVSAPGVPAQIQDSTPNNTDAIALPAKLPNGALNPNDPFARNGDAALINYAFGDLPADTFENNHVLRGVVDLSGTFWDWDYDGALVAAHSWLASTSTGMLDFSQLISDVKNGTYNFIDPSQNSPATRAALSPPADKTSTTDLDEAAIRATHGVFALPGGPLEVGVGAELRYEATDDPDLNPNMMYQGLGVAHTIGHHTVASVYGEILAPILPTFEADVSGRYDHYSDFGGNFSPKAGLRWTPIDQIALRGTYSEGFRAPSFAENGSSAAEGFITFSPPQSFINAHGNDGYVQPYPLAELSSANPNVKPETSRNFTLGTVLRPFSDDSLVATVDYYNIIKRDVIAQSDPSVALTDYFAGTPIPPGYAIVLDIADPKFPNAPRRPVVVSSPYVNADALKTDGIDVEIAATAPLPYDITGAADLDVTEIMHYTFTFPGEAPVSYVGLQSPYGLSSGAGTPRWRGSLSDSFTWQALTVTGILYYTSGLGEYGVDVNGPGTTLPFCLYPNPIDNCRMGAFWDFDLSGRYKLSDHLELFGSIRNLFDTPPPLNPPNYAAVNYNPTFAQAGIIGRFFSIGVRVSY